MLHNKLGLISYNINKAFSGYTIFSPLGQLSTFLINMKGDVVHEWELPSMPGNYAYLFYLTAICWQHRKPKRDRWIFRAKVANSLRWIGTVV